MALDLQQLINSSLSLRLMSAVARSLPPRLGHRVAFAIADLFARRPESGPVQAMRLNQWVASRQALEGEKLDQAVRETLRCSARFLFDVYHYRDDYDAARQLIVVDPSFQQITQRPEFDSRGLVITGLHLSGFDLVLQWLVKGGLKLLVLTISDPQGGRRIEYETRKQIGMNLMPASFSTIRQAIKHLQKGGMVLTGVDRPIEAPEVMPHFFGHPAPLPVHHIFLAMKARVPLMLAFTYLWPDGRYHVFASDPIEMDSVDTSPEILLRNAENVLGRAEEFIRQAPRQWSVPLPVWPDLLNIVP